MDTALPNPNPSPSASPTWPDLSRSSRRITLWAALGLILLVPMVLMSFFVTLWTERGSRCFTYGETCPTIPGEVLYGFFWASVAAGLVAAVWPRTRWMSARSGAVILQWTLQVVLCLIILSGA
ncbi:hypothetical protein SGFS_046340 [Streptomyces graminofaciens]|jgi:hypothetical protein|uniref:Uncharacterized protein n=1 Tax=Streptomyces graminofaciens TaxID=68212 RepID=A0ABN5VIW2_9ACTN|nr:hypothetical protein [Streptomyces graminofaciens]BBC33340.1 hypothetical protein SGFS_046340 [Streptomyces graminofaciens]